MSDDNKQLLDLLKYFGDIIKDFNITLGALNQSLNTLSSNVEKIPKLTDLKDSLEDLQNTIVQQNEKLHEDTSECDQIRELEKSIIQEIRVLQATIEKMDITEVTKLILGLEQSKNQTQVALAQADVSKDKEDTRRKFIENATKVILKTFWFILKVGAGMFVFIKFVLPYIAKYIGISVT
jgi:chromosome segregation ATPase